MRNLLLLLLTLVVLPLAAQYQLQPIFSGEDGLYLEELEQVQLSNTSGSIRQVRLRAEVRDGAGSLLYSRETLPFTLEAGRVAPVTQIWEKGNKTFVAPALESQLRGQNALPRGQYEICVLVLNALNNTAEVQQCRWMEVATAEMQTASFQASGQVRLSYQYAEREWFGSTLPPSYWRLEANPTFSWEGIPVGLDVFWTNEDNRFGRPMDAVSLRFDAQAFRTRLRQQLEVKLAAKQEAMRQRHQPDFSEEANLRQILTQTEQVDTQLFYQWLPQAEARLDSLQQLEQRIEKTASSYADSLIEQQQVHLAESDSLQDLRAEKRELENRIDQLRQQRRQYEQLRQRKAYLASRWQKVQTLNDSIRQIGTAVTEDLSPAQFKQQLLAHQLLEPGKAALLSIEQLQLGAYYLDHTPLAFNGSQLSGVNIAIRPAPGWTISVAGGKMQAPRFADSLFAALPAPYTLANKISWEAGHQLEYYLGHIYTWEKATTLEGTGQSNWILATGWHWRLPELSSRWSVDIATSGVGNYQGDAVAWQTEFSSSLLHDRLQLDGKWQKVGSQYQDFGSPFLRSGMETQEVQLNGQWWQDRLQLGLFYQHDHNRPLGYSPFRLQNHQLGAQLQLDLPNGTRGALRLGYNLLEQREANSPTYLYHAYLQQSWKLGSMRSTSKLLLQHNQQQWHPLLPPSLYHYREFRQQTQIRENWSVELIGYHTYEQVNGAQPNLTYTREQAFSGIDLQNACTFANGSYLQALVGFYRYYRSTDLNWKAQASAQVALQAQLYLKLSAAWGALPHFTAAYDQSFLNVMLVWRVGSSW